MSYTYTSCCHYFNIKCGYKNKLNIYKHSIIKTKDTIFLIQTMFSLTFSDKYPLII